MTPAEKWNWIVENERLILKAAATRVRRRITDDEAQDLRLRVFGWLDLYDPNKGTAITTYIYNNVHAFMPSLHRGEDRFDELEDYMHPQVQANGFERVVAREVLEAVEDLPEDQAIAVRMRAEEATLDSVGEALAVSRESARQLHMRALKKLGAKFDRQAPVRRRSPTANATAPAKQTLAVAPYKSETYMRGYFERLRVLTLGSE